MRPLAPRALGGLVLLWALVSVVSAWQAAAARGPDRVTALEAGFRALAASAPASGDIGFLRHYEHPDSPDDIRDYYVAQYAFAPRLVARRTDVDLLIVAQGAAHPDRDERLAGFALVASSPEGHRLYRKLIR
ncbi:MAG TPA: hypothetical protein VFO58_04125 [Vicinamibacterales bacterium]|nr:hypothetical protein [Vicinamibacterales bacterium]